MAKHNTVSRGAEFWQKTIKQFSASGLSQTDFCRQHSLSLNTFRRWLYQSLKNYPAPKLSSSGEALFVPVRVKDKNSVHGAGTIEILLRNDRRIRVTSGFNADEVASLARVLEEV